MTEKKIVMEGRCCDIDDRAGSVVLLVAPGSSVSDSAGAESNVVSESVHAFERPANFGVWGMGSYYPLNDM